MVGDGFTAGGRPLRSIIMKKIPLISLLMIVTIFVSCRDQEQHLSSQNTEVESDLSPESLHGAMIALDARFSDDEKQAFLEQRDDGLDPFNGEDHFNHKVVAMRLRDEWGLWGDSRLKLYFSARGISHADWISSAILDGWAEHLGTGTVDEEALFKKYASLERQWRSREASRKK